MDKRSLLAIFLCVLLAIVYPKIIAKFFPESLKSKKQPVAKEQVDEKTTQVAAEANDSVQEEESVPASVVPVKSKAPAIKEEEVVFETDIYRITFSNFGASMKEIVFKKMKDGLKPQTVFADLDAKWRPFAINKLGHFGDLSSAPFTIHKLEDRVIFSYVVNEKLTVKKEFVFHDGSYLIGFRLFIENTSDETVVVNENVDINCGTLIRKGKKGKVAYLGVDGLSIYKKPGKDEDVNVFQLKTKYIGNEKKLKALTDSLDKKVFRWIGVRNKSDALLLINNGFKTPMWALKYKGTDLEEGYTGVTRFEEIPYLKAGESFIREFSFYAGPKYLSVLSSLGNKCDRILDLGMFWYISRIMIYVLTFLHGIVKNYGLAIIVLTIGIKILLHPLTQKSFKSMNRMKALQPELNTLKEKYKDNPKKMQTETMAIYKKHGVNPLGGCLPMLLQMPVFFALFNTIRNFVELQGASFLWVKDLSMPDTVAVVAGFPVNPLPLIMGVTTYWQQKMSTVDPNQQKMLMFMPLFLTFIFYNFSSGLVIYWLVNNILTIGQQYLTKQKAA